MASKEYLKQYYQEHKEKAKQYARDKRTNIRKAINNGTFVIPDIKEKECNACNNILNVSQFSFHKSSGTYHSECKSCRKNKARIYRQVNKEKVRLSERKRSKKRREDVQFKIIGSMRSRLHSCYVKKQMHSVEYLDLDTETFFDWLQFAMDTEDFNEGLTLENYGKVWHLDHIIPCNLFDLTNDEEVKLCFHWTNLQPLRADINSAKKDGIWPWFIFSRNYRLKLFLENYENDNEYMNKEHIVSITAVAEKLVVSRRSNFLCKVKISEQGQSAPTPLISVMQANEEGSETKEVSA